MTLCRVKVHVLPIEIRTNLAIKLYPDQSLRKQPFKLSGAYAVSTNNSTHIVGKSLLAIQARRR